MKIERWRNTKTGELYSPGDWGRGTPLENVEPVEIELTHEELQNAWQEIEDLYFEEEEQKYKEEVRNQLPTGIPADKVDFVTDSVAYFITNDVLNGCDEVWCFNGGFNEFLMDALNMADIDYGFRDGELVIL